MVYQLFRGGLGGSYLSLRYLPESERNNATGV